MFTRVAAAYFAFMAAVISGPVQAESGPDTIIDSAILGAFVHEISNDDEGGIDANLELRLRPLFGKDWAVEILPTIGATVNFSGDTNTAYLGATARYRLTNSFFIEGFFGLTVHDADTPTASDGLDLGCGLLFREGAGVGYQRDRHSLGIYVSHASHGGIICDEPENDGITSVGLRYGYHF